MVVMARKRPGIRRYRFRMEPAEPDRICGTIEGGGATQPGEYGSPGGLLVWARVGGPNSPW